MEKQKTLLDYMLEAFIGTNPDPKKLEELSIYDKLKFINVDEEIKKGRLPER